MKMNLSGMMLGVVLALAGPARSAATTGPPIEVFLPTSMPAGQGVPPQLGARITMPVQINVAGLQGAAPGQMLVVPLLDGTSVPVQLDHRESLLPGGSTWVGRVPGVENSLFILSIYQGAGSMHFTVNGKRMAQLFYMGNGAHLMFEPDAPPPQSCPIVRISPSSVAKTPASPAPPPAPPLGPSSGDTGSSIEIVVFVTPQTISAVGGMSAATSYAMNDVSYTNTCYNNSQTNCQMRLLAVLQGNISESGTMSQTLTAFAADSTVKAYRESYQADLVSLLVSHGQDIGGGASIEGIAYLMNAYNLDDSSPGYSVFHYTDSRTFAHETGHNLGGGHYPGDEYPSNPSQDQGVFSYSYAHHFDSACQFFYTVMAYNYHGSCLPSIEIQDPVDYYSTPDKSYFQSPLIGGVLGTSDHNNTATFRVTGPHVAAWKGVTTTAYVDRAYGGIQNGSQSAPYTTVAPAVNAVNASGTVSIRAGNYAETFPNGINKAVTLGNWGNIGVVQIGAP